jgi:thiamine phosphate synthase YjbQ (UPF0047 family)
MVDITPEIKAIVAKSGCKEGVATIISKHSTVRVLALHELQLSCSICSS